MISFENKHTVGDKVFVIGSRQSQRNILEVYEVTITAVSGVLSAGDKAEIIYYFKKDVENANEKDSPMPAEKVFATSKEAEEDLINAGSELRDEYQKVIDIKQKEVNALKQEQKNIMRVMPNEKVFVPTAEDQKLEEVTTEPESVAV